MTDWKYEELIEDLKEQLFVVKSYKKFAESEEKKYKGLFETDDKFDIQKHEFWRATIYECDKQINFLNSILKKSDEMILEDIREVEEAEKFRRELEIEAHGF